MTYEETLGRLQTTTARAVLSLWEQHEAGLLTRAEFTDLAVLVLETATRQGLSLGALSIRGYLEAVTGMPQPVAVPEPEPEAGRLAKGVGTILAGHTADVPTRLERMALNEPVQAATDGARHAMLADRRVTGWTRGLEGDGCELCRWWWRNGRVWQPDHPMPRHTGCVCHPVPAVSVTTDNAQTTKQAWEAARRAGRVPAGRTAA